MSPPTEQVSSMEKFIILWDGMFLVLLVPSLLKSTAADNLETSGSEVKREPSVGGETTAY